MKQISLVIAKLFLFGLLSLSLNSKAVNYEVVLVRGEVSYKGIGLKKGIKIEIPDLDNPSTMKQEIQHFNFNSASDEVQLLNHDRKKIVMVSARNNKQGRDLLLATRAKKYIKSDFEFKRAFTPGLKVLTLTSDDTIMCTGLDKFRFTGDKQLAFAYNFQGKEIFRVAGRNDSLFLSHKQLFEINTPQGAKKINSFEVENIRVVFLNVSKEGNSIIEIEEIPPFNLYFLDDIIRYYAGIQYDNIRPDEEFVFNTILSNFISENQIQREAGLYTKEEAHEWLNNRIHSIFLQQ